MKQHKIWDNLKTALRHNSNPHLTHSGVMLYHLSYQGSSADHQFTYTNQGKAKQSKHLNLICRWILKPCTFTNVYGLPSIILQGTISSWKHCHSSVYLNMSLVVLLWVGGLLQPVSKDDIATWLRRIFCTLISSTLCTCIASIHALIYVCWLSNPLWTRTTTVNDTNIHVLIETPHDGSHYGEIWTGVYTYNVFYSIHVQMIYYATWRGNHSNYGHNTMTCVLNALEDTVLYLSTCCVWVNHCCIMVYLYLSFHLIQDTTDQSHLVDVRKHLISCTKQTRVGTH